MALAGFAGQGPTPPPTQGEASAPLTLWYGAPNTKRALAIEGLFDFADAPLLRWTPDANTPNTATSTPFLDDVLTLRVGARYGVSKRLGVAASIPVVLSHTINTPESVGPVFGDIQLSAPIWLLTAGSTHLSVVPTARLPTGKASRYLGDDGPGGSVVAVASTTAGPIEASANLGLNYRTFEQESNVLPGPGLIGGASIGAVVREGLGLHLEGRFHQRLIGQEAPSAPEFYDKAVGGAEVLLGGRGRLNGGTFVSAGVGTGLVRGFATPRYRAILGIGHRFGGTGVDRVAKVPQEPKAPKQPKAPKIVEATELPVVVQVHDESGVPIRGMVTASNGTTARLVDGQATLVLPPGGWTVDVEADGFGSQARDLTLVPAQRSGEQIEFILLPQSGDATLNMELVSPEGASIDDARVSLDGRPVGTSGSGGGVVVHGLADKAVEVQVQAESFRERTATRVIPSTGDAPVELLLARQRGAVQVQVVDSNKSPIPGVRARFSGPDRLGPYALGDLGSRTFVLRPGDWQALVSHPDYGIQQRGVHVEDQDTELTRVQVVLQPPEDGAADLLLRVRDRDNRDVPGATVELGGVPFGATSSGGQMRLPNLQPGPRSVRISGQNVVETTSDMLLHNGIQEQLIVVDWQPGSTLVRARGPEGMAPDAAARFQGPTLMDVLPLGPDGVEVLRLNAGIWQVLVSSPSLGMAQQGIDVAAAAQGLSIVDVMLGSVEERGKTLLVEVVDPGGQPIEGASIALDSTSRGTTASLGTLAIPNIDAGNSVLDVSASPFSSQQRPVRMTKEEQNERFDLEWGIGAVRVRARAGSEWVTDAVIRLGGPRFIPATPVDPDGQRLFGLEPGTWQVLVSSPDQGLQQVSVDVPDRPQLTELTVELGPAPADVAQTLVRVQAPDGSPIPDAMVRLDELEPVAADGGFAALPNVSPGPHRLEITAPDFEPVVLDEVDVVEGLNERIVPMPWVPRPLTVLVRGPAGPIAATLALNGPIEVPTVQTDSSGEAKLELAPGKWRIFAFADGLGVQRAQIELSERTGVSEAEFDLKPAKVSIDGATIRVSEQIFFPSGKAVLDRSSIDLLDEVANTLLAHPELVSVEIGGHTDPQGAIADNMRLSQERADAVATALVERGVAQERLNARGYGPTQPQAGNDTADGRAKNRRVEFVSETQE